MLSVNPQPYQAQLQKVSIIMNRKALVGVGVLAGLAQVVAGVAMYRAGVYFAPWSMFVNLFLLLICIVVGTKWYAAHYLNGKITYLRALTVGVVISISTGFNLCALQSDLHFMVLSKFPG